MGEHVQVLSQWAAMDMNSTAIEPGMQESHTQDGRLQVLRRCRLFSQWPQARLAELAAVAHFQRYARAAQVFARQPQLREILVIAAGRVEVSRSTAAGRKFMRSIVGPNEALALVRLLECVPLHYEYWAYDDCVLLHLPCRNLIAILDAEPILWRDVALLMCERQGASVRLLNDQTLGTLEQRMAATLVELMNIRSRTAKEPLQLHISQESLGAMLGVTRQSVNAILNALEGQGLIGRGYNRIAICDLPALLDVAARRN